MRSHDKRERIRADPAHRHHGGSGDLRGHPGHDAGQPAARHVQGTGEQDRRCTTPRPRLNSAVTAVESNNSLADHGVHAEPVAPERRTTHHRGGAERHLQRVRQPEPGQHGHQLGFQRRRHGVGPGHDHLQRPHDHGARAGALVDEGRRSCPSRRPTPTRTSSSRARATSTPSRTTARPTRRGRRMRRPSCAATTSRGNSTTNLAAPADSTHTVSVGLQLNGTLTDSGPQLLPQPGGVGLLSDYFDQAHQAALMTEAQVGETNAASSGGTSVAPSKFTTSNITAIDRLHVHLRDQDVHLHQHAGGTAALSRSAPAGEPSPPAPSSTSRT